MVKYSLESLFPFGNMQFSQILLNFKDIVIKLHDNGTVTFQYTSVHVRSD